jgi:hypothetical protein
LPLCPSMRMAHLHTCLIERHQRPLALSPDRALLTCLTLTTSQKKGASLRQPAAKNRACANSLTATDVPAAAMSTLSSPKHRSTVQSDVTNNIVTRRAPALQQQVARCRSAHACTPTHTTIRVYTTALAFTVATQAENSETRGQPAIRLDAQHTYGQTAHTQVFVLLTQHQTPRKVLGDQAI